MGKFKRALRFLICKLLNVPNRPVLTDWEIRNIEAHDARAYICIDRNGIYWITPGSVENAKAAAAGRSLIYYIGREILDFDEAIRTRLKKLDQSNAPKRTPYLDALLAQEENNPTQREVLKNGEEEK